MRTIFRNAKVFTANLEQTSVSDATCLVINDGLVEFVGSNDDSFVETAIAQGCDVQNAEGKTIAPGFIDGY
jgi:predicted amidohydrolase YtcJ